MKNPAALVSRHPRWHEHTGASWGLEVVLQLHGQSATMRHPFQRRQPFPEDDFAKAFLAEMCAIGIETEIRRYGADFMSFEADLRSRWRDGPAGCPLVRIPMVARVDWGTAGLQIRLCTLIVGDEGGHPVFLMRSARSAAVVKMSLDRLRFLHDSWRRWPIVLPSMLLTVLWHRESPRRVLTHRERRDAAHPSRSHARASYPKEAGSR